MRVNSGLLGTFARVPGDYFTGSRPAPGNYFIFCAQLHISEIIIYKCALISTEYGIC